MSDNIVPIPRPEGFDLEAFRPTQPGSIGGVEKLQAGLPVHSISQAKDFVRLHAHDDYWSHELCFVSVPVKGAKKESLHLVRPDLALRYLPGGRLKYALLALAAKPYDLFFLCSIPTRNMDNKWNADNAAACGQARRRWVQVTSRGDEGVEGYHVQYTQDADAFKEPKWPTASLPELIQRAFEGRCITSEDHPALLRLIGGAQEIGE